MNCLLRWKLLLGYRSAILRHRLLLRGDWIQCANIERQFEASRLNQEQKTYLSELLRKVTR